MSTERINTSLSQDIVAYLRNQGMTLKQIGKLMGVSESFISYVRRGARSFTIVRLRVLERAIKVPLPLIFLAALNAKSIPKELKSQYDALRQVLNSAAEPNKLFEE